MFDCFEPDFFDDNESESHRGDPHKVLRLCRQVQRMVALALPGLADEAVRGLIVLDVLPAPDASRLLVRLCPSATQTLPEDLLRRLAEAAPHLRREVAAGIHRKRAPELSLVVVAPPAEVEEVHDA